MNSEQNTPDMNIINSRRDHSNTSDGELFDV